MASLTKYRGRWKASIRRKEHRPIYETFNKISDARGFINKVESDIQQQKYKDISEATNTSLRTVLHRYIREKLQLMKFETTTLKNYLFDYTKGIYRRCFFLIIVIPPTSRYKTNILFIIMIKDNWRGTSCSIHLIRPYLFTCFGVYSIS